MNANFDVLERIQELRKMKGWTIYRLAEESELTQSTIANMFTRKTLPSISTLVALCNAFGITLSQFFDADSKEFEIKNTYNLLNEEDKKL